MTFCRACVRVALEDFGPEILTLGTPARDVFALEQMGKPLTRAVMIDVVKATRERIADREAKNAPRSPNRTQTAHQTAHRGGRRRS